MYPGLAADVAEEKPRRSGVQEPEKRALKPRPLELVFAESLNRHRAGVKTRADWQSYLD